MQSQKIGIKPYWTRGKSVVDHANAGTITLSPLFFFVRIEKKYMTKFLNLKILIFISLILSIPLYFLMFDWGRVIYINYNYLVVILMASCMVNCMVNLF